MTENQKQFLEKVSQDENLQQKVKKIDSKDHAAVIELAKSVGVTLTEEDLREEEHDKNEVNDDELEAVNGGCYVGNMTIEDCYCICPLIGGGEGSDIRRQVRHDQMTVEIIDGEGDRVGCACVVYGEGGDARNDHTVCMCSFGGDGINRVTFPSGYKLKNV